MPPSSYQRLAACLYFNGLPQPGETVYFQSTVTLGSGYHSHTEGRPKGSFYTWTGNEYGAAVTQFDGCAYIDWYAPAAAGSHAVLAYTALGGSTAIFINVWINPFVGGWLSALGSSPDYQLVGNAGYPGQNHPQNHFGTPNAVFALPLIMRDFRNQTGIIAQINDMSLGWGGTFDLGPLYATQNCPVWAAQFWTNSCVHAEHRLGRNADIPTSPLGNYVGTFLAIATFYGANDGPGGIHPEGNHYHLRFAY